MEPLPLPKFTRSFRPGKIFKTFAEHIRKLDDNIGKHRHLSAAEILTLGADAMDKDADVKASQWNCSSTTVRRSLSSSAFGLLLTDNLIFELSLEDAQAVHPDSVTSYPQWDETMQKLYFDVGERQILQSTQIMVSQLVVSWSYVDKPLHFHDVNCPPQPLPNTTWKSLRILTRWLPLPNDR